MGKHKSEGLAALHLAYDSLTKASEQSLRAAFDFGQIIDALANTYTFEVMADEIGRHRTTIALYSRLYRKFTRVEHLIAASRELGTFDIARLCSEQALVHYKIIYHCANCGSYDVQRQRALVKAA